MRKNNVVKFEKSTYNILDANSTFFYVILMGLVAPLVALIVMWGVYGLNKLGVSEYACTFVNNLLIVLIMPILYFIVAVVFHKKKHINYVNALNLNKNFNALNFIISFAMLAVVIVCFFPIVNMIYAVLGHWGFNVSGSVAFEMNNWWTLLIGVVAYCLLPAIAEEVLFRGIILKGTLQKAKPIVAISISAFAFFIMHGSLVQSFYQILLGFLLSVVGYYTVNIIYPIALHFINNLVVILFGYYNIGGFLNGFSLTAGGWAVAIAIALAGVASLVGLTYLIRHINKNKANYSNNFVVEGDNIIFESNKKLTFKQLLKSFSMDEKFYFYGAWIVAIVMWMFNSI